MGAVEAGKLDVLEKPEEVGAIPVWEREKPNLRLIQGGAAVLQEAELGSDQKKQLTEDVAKALTEGDEGEKEETVRQGPENVLILNENKIAPTGEEKVEIKTGPPNKDESEKKIEVAKTKEASPENRDEQERLEKIFKEIGEVIISGWREYLNEYMKDPNSSHLLRFARDNVLYISRICEPFNAELKKLKPAENGFNAFRVVAESLREIFNQTMLNRLTENTYDPGNTDKLKSELKDELSQLLSISQEYRRGLENYISRITEQLLYNEQTVFVPAT